MKKLTLPGNWRSLLLAAVLVGSCFTAGAIAVGKGSNLKWASWTGFGEDTTREERIERNAKGQILKRIEITRYQSGKTLWDWLELASNLAVPVLIFILGYQLQQREQKRAAAQAEVERERAERQASAERERAERQASAEREIAATNLREEALQTYFDRMAELLVDRNRISELLHTGESDNPIKDVARIRTVTILRRLEGDRERGASVLHFLRDAELLKFLLSRGNLEGINLEKANLMEANLERGRLMEANLKAAMLMEANLKAAMLMEANLEGAILEKANLEEASLWNTNLERAYLMQANLVNAMLIKARLVEADLWKANLTQAVLLGANLEGAKLVEANLVEANLEGANLEGAFLTGTNLEEANLRKARNLTPEQVKAANNWEKAHYSPEFRQQLGLPPE